MEENNTTTVKFTLKTGITFVNALDMVVRYTKWYSVGCAIFHVLLILFFIFFFLLFGFVFSNCYL